MFYFPSIAVQSYVKSLSFHLNQWNKFTNIYLGVYVEQQQLIIRLSGTKRDKYDDGSPIIIRINTQFSKFYDLFGLFISTESQWRCSFITKASFSSCSFILKFFEFNIGIDYNLWSSSSKTKKRKNKLKIKRFDEPHKCIFILWESL